MLDRSKWMTRFAYATGPAVPAPYTQSPPYQSAGGVTLPFHGTCDFFNDEQQRYCDFTVGSTDVADNTLLHQFGTVAGRQCMKLMAYKGFPDPGFNWATFRSGMVLSKLTFKPTSVRAYHISCELYMPDANGSWPALWLAPKLSPDGQQGLHQAVECDVNADVNRRGERERGQRLRAVAAGDHGVGHTKSHHGQLAHQHRAGMLQDDAPLGHAQRAAGWKMTSVSLLSEGRR